MSLGANQTFLEDTNKITFTDEDMEVRNLNHRRPLHLVATINQILIKKALVDTGVFVNLILVNTLEVAEIPENKILGFPMEVTRFRGTGEYIVGYRHLWLKVGPTAALTHFHMVKTEVSYHVLLKRPWLHKHHLIPSTYHKCVNGRLNGRPIRIATNPSPFEQAEAHLVEIIFYDEWAPSRESTMAKTSGTFVPKWDDIEDDLEPNLRELLKQKRKKEALATESDSSPCCVRVKKPNDRIVYRL